MAVPVETAKPTFTWGGAKSLFPATYSGFTGFAGPRNYDLSRDGQRFLMIKDATAEQSENPLVLVENWFDELKERVPIRD